MAGQDIIGSVFTVIVFLAFIGVVWWAFSKRNAKRFEEDAYLVFDDDEINTVKKTRSQ